MGKNRKYSLEFKEQAVKLANELGSIRAAAKQLGVSDGNIHGWMRKFGKSGKLLASPNETPEAEMNRLRKENEELKKVNYILKRAAAFFSQDHLK
jgi:transposase